MQEIASFGSTLATAGLVGFAICALFTKDDPDLPRRLDRLLIIGSILILIFHQEWGLMMLAAVLTISIVRKVGGK